MNKTKHFKHLRQLQKDHLKPVDEKFEVMNYEIMYLLNKGKRNGDTLAFLLGIDTQQVREHILNIRLNFHKYVNPSDKRFLLADHKGYYLSDNKKLKKAYLKMLKQAAVQKNIQALELEFTI